MIATSGALSALSLGALSIEFYTFMNAKKVAATVDETAGRRKEKNGIC